MLPDLPSYKAELKKLLLLYFQHEITQNLGVFQQAGRRTAHEGDRMKVVRADGSVEESGYGHASAELKLKFADIPALTQKDRITLLKNMAKDMADQMTSYMFQSLDKTLEQAGQVFDNKGGPIDAEMILKILDTIQIDFNGDGSHNTLTLVTAPESRELAEIAFKTLETNPELRARYEQIIEKKRMNWRDREASRKLVG
jgi:hypothetical protein